MNMFAALEAVPPSFAHLPMILGPDGAKLSKRHGAVDIREYRELGYLPKALLNYLVRLGWSHGDQEVFSIEEMIMYFDIADVNQSASSFNPEKLRWLNQQHIMAAPPEEIAAALLPYLEQAALNPQNGPGLADLADGFRERAETLQQMVATSRYCYEDFENIDAKAAKKNLRPVILEPLRVARQRLSELTEWSKSSIADTIDRVASEFDLNLGKLGQPVRVAVTGGPVSPPIDVTLWLVGQERTIRRLDFAIDLIEKRAALSQA